MLKFNSYRAQRYLRSKFVEGAFLLSSEASDIELELLTQMRNIVKQTIGDVALGDAWKILKLSDTELLIRPGEMWFQGLPFNFRSGKDQLVSGAVLSLGLAPVGVAIIDEPAGFGKILKFNYGTTTPTNNYRIVVTAQEELITEIEDEFLQNANLTESTGQKVRLVFQINVVPESTQSESPIPYSDEDYSSPGITNYPSTGGQAAPNLSNQVIVYPDSGLNGEVIALNFVPGAEKIDGRDIELVLRNDSSLGGGHPLPKTISEQAAFSNGTLIDSNGNRYHVNAVFNDVVSTQIVIRIDKEYGQVDPQILNASAFILLKREVFVTDEVTGLPEGKLNLALATVDWDATGLIKHESSIVDLRTSVLKYADYQLYINNKEGLRLTDGGDIAWNLTTQKVSWSSSLTLINPHGPNNTIAAASIPLVEGGTIAYDLDLISGGAIQKGTVAVTVTAFGSTSTLSAAVLNAVKIGNIVIDSVGTVAEITAIDDVANTITTSPALLANGAAVIYLDSFAPGTAPLSEKTYVLAVRKSNKAFVGNDDTGLENGESSQVGQGISNQNRIFIGILNDADYSPIYTTNHYVTNGQSLLAAISSLDAAAFGKADRNLGNLTAPTVINQDLNPVSYSDAVNIKQGEIFPFDQIRTARLMPEKATYTLIGTFTNGSNLITGVIGTLPTRQQPLRYMVSTSSLPNDNYFIEAFISGTTLQMEDIITGVTGTYTFTLLPALQILTDDATLSGEGSKLIFVVTGNSTTGRTGPIICKTGDSSAGGTTGDVLFASGLTSGIRGHATFDMPVVRPTVSLATNLGDTTHLWNSTWTAALNASTQMGIRDPLTSIAALNAFVTSANGFTGGYWRDTQSLTGADGYGYFGRTVNNATFRTSRLLLSTGDNNGAGGTGDILARTGNNGGGGTRGEFKIEALQLNMNNTKIVSLLAPTNPLEASNKAYTDAQGSAISIVSTGGTTTLTSTSPRFTVVTGTLGQFVRLPSTAGLQVGEIFGVNYNGTAGLLTLQDSTGATLLTMGPDTVAFATVMSTGAQTWNTYFIIEGGSYLEIRKTLGENIAIRKPVYISEGAADGRTASQVYTLDETNDLRMEFVGLTTSTDVAGNEIKVQTSGVMSGFSGLTPGKPVYWYGGALSQVIPTTLYTWQITVGKAISATEILINPDQATSAIFITDSTATDPILNNQVVDFPINNLIFDGSLTRSFEIEYWVYRTTSTTEEAEAGVLRGVYSTVAASWQIASGGFVGLSGVNFNITALGQVTYTSSNLGGISYVGNIKFSVKQQLGV